MDSPTSAPRRREYNVDLIRVLACLTVIACHSNTLGDRDLSGTFWKVLFTDGVTYFFIMQGFFFFRKGFIPTLKRTVTKVFIPGMITIFVIEFYAPLYSGESLLYCIRNIPSGVIPVIWSSIASFMVTDLKRTGYLWYIFTYTMNALAYPLLKPLCTKETARRYRLYVVGLTVLYLIIKEINECRPLTYKPDIARLLPVSMMMVVLGYEIYSHKDEIRGSRPVRYASISAYVFLMLFRTFVQNRVLLVQPSNSSFTMWYDSTAIMSATAMILFLLSFDSEKLHPAVKAVAKIGPYTFLMYLIHSPLIAFMNHFGFDRTLHHIFGSGEDMFIKQEIGYLFTRISIEFIVILLAAVLLKKIAALFRKS